MEKQKGGTPSFWKRIWNDPVWSKVISAGIIGLVGALWVGIQSLAQQISLSASFNRVLLFFSTATAVNNTVLLFAAILLLWLAYHVFRSLRQLSVLSNGASTLPADNASARDVSDHPAIPAPPAGPILLRFGSQRGDRPLMQVFTVIGGAPKLRTGNDGHYGEVVEVDINMGEDQWDCDIILGREAKDISIVARPDLSFIFYLKVTVAAKTADVFPIKWIALRADVSTISKGVGQVEKAYPAGWKAGIGQWMNADHSISDVVNACFGDEGWKYHQLIGLRVRGKGVLASITLS